MSSPPERALLALLLTALATPLEASVDASAYDAFWLWSATRHQPVLEQASTLYLHQGEILDRPGGPRFVKLGRVPSPLKAGQVWLVVRVNALPLSPAHEQVLVRLYEWWRAAGARVAGIQIDFDARTQYLHEYADFLRDLRQRLPADLRLSITGLMDWSSNADPAAIAQLKGVVDEVVVQTYQGRHSIPDYAAYLPRMNRLGVPFKIGLIQGGEWQEPGYLRGNEWFRGYVVFLQNL